MNTPLTALQMEERLDRYLDPVLSSRRTATGIAQILAHCYREQQELILSWVKIIAHSHAELAYQFASHARQALELLSENELETWIIQAMDVYDSTGLYAAIKVFTDVAAFAQAQKNKGLAFEEISVILETLVMGLNGRPLRLASAQLTYTDTETLYLPPLLNDYAERQDNFRLYKVMAVHLWAQTWFGSWHLNAHQALERFPDPAKACRLLQILERLRLDACIERTLPGIARDIDYLLAQLGQTRIPPGWQALAQHLATKHATVHTSYELLAQIYAQEIPDSVCYQSVFIPERVEEVKALRIAREKAAFRVAVVKMCQQRSDRSPEPLADTLEIQKIADETQPQGFTFELSLDGQPLIPPDNVSSLMESIIQDIGAIPEDYLVAAGPGEYKMFEATAPTERASETVWQGVYHEEGAFLYPEWDYERRHYRKNWCVLREIDVFPQPESFVSNTLQRYRGLVKQLRRTFEILRGENKLLKAQPNGEDLDLDAWVKAYADAQQGLEMSQGLFTKLYKEERNIAVMFMVDMSGSTKGWINDAERESLVLLCEALETLGDRYAIYGFSGTTRKRCEIYRIKRFDEAYTNLVQQRISGIKPQDYTRMGVAIRHLTQLLNQVEARIKLLITLSDGRPDDYGDQYRGRYGIEDTRQA